MYRTCVESTVMKYSLQEHQLSNGIRVVTIMRPDAATSALTAYLRVGSRFESKQQRGLSHFLEHMVFQGTTSYPTARALNIAAEGMGSTLDAATARDYTQYEHHVANERLSDSCALLAEIISAPNFNGIESERSIILEEALDEFSADGRRIDADTLTRRCIWGNRDLGQPIIGDLESIRRFTQSDLTHFHHRHYVAENLVLGICGPDTHLDLLNKLKPFEALRTGRPNIIGSREYKPRTKTAVIVEDERSQCDSRLVFLTPGRSAGTAAQYHLLRRALDDGLASRMHERLGNQLGLAYEQWAFWDSFPDVGAFEFGTVVSPDKVITFFAEITKLLRELVANPPQGAELDRLRFRARWSLETAQDSAAGVLALHTPAYIYEEPVRTVEARIRRLEQVTSMELAATARELLSQRYVASVVGPVDGIKAHHIHAAVKPQLSP